jgi:hypothetical protein
MNLARITTVYKIYYRMSIGYYDIQTLVRTPPALPPLSRSISATLGTCGQAYLGSWIQVTSATDDSSENTSKGVLKARVFRGRLLSRFIANVI